MLTLADLFGNLYYVLAQLLVNLVTAFPLTGALVNLITAIPFSLYQLALPPDQRCPPLCP